MTRTTIRKWVFYAGPLLAICWCTVVFAGKVKKKKTKPLYRFTIDELIQEIQNPALNEKDLRIVGKELEDRVPTTVSEVENLLSLIGQDKGKARQFAINAVSNTLDPSLKSGFLRGLANKSPIINAVAASMCGKLQIMEATDDIVKLINRLGPINGTVENDRERASLACVLALGEIRDESKIPFLVSLFQKMLGYETIALIKYGKKVVPAMFREIATTRQDTVRSQAERVLLSIRDPAATPLFEKEMENPDSPSRTISMRVLLNINPSPTMQRLVQLWEKENNPIIASILLDHLDYHKITDSRYGPFAQEILRSSDNGEFRKKAVCILGKIGGEESRNALKGALKDKNPLVRVFASKSLKYLESHSTSKPGQ